MPALGELTVHAAFIRAPIIERVGPGVEVLARLKDGRVVAVRQGNVIATAFHPELAGGGPLPSARGLPGLLSRWRPGALKPRRVGPDMPDGRHNDEDQPRTGPRSEEASQPAGRHRE